MEDIKKYSEHLKLAAQALQIYLTKLEASGFSGTEPILTDNARKDLRTVLEDTSLNEELAKPTLDAFRIFYLIRHLYHLLDRTYQMFATHRLDIFHRGSRTSSGHMISESYLQDLNESFQEISEIHRQITYEHSQASFLTFLSQHITIVGLGDLEKCRQIYKDYLDENQGLYVVDLYIFKLQATIDEFTGKPEGREIIKRIAKDLEELKTLILVQGCPEANEAGTTPNKEVNVIQRLLQKFNLIPDGVGRPLEMIWEGLTGTRSKSHTPASVAKLLSAREDKKYGFIIIDKSIPRPIVHNFWTLVDMDYLLRQELYQPRGVGVNSKSLRRFSTIVSEAELGAEVRQKISFVDAFDSHDPSKNYYFVLETLDGKNYHFLIPYVSNVNYLPASWLDALRDEARVPSQRLRAYNQLFEAELIKHLQEPFVELVAMTREEVQRDEAHWRSLRNAIKRDIVDYVRGLMEDWVVLSLEKFKKLLGEESLYRKIVREITNRIEAETDTERLSPEVAAQYGIEMYLSYFRDIDRVKRGFRSDVISTYKRGYEEKLLHAWGGSGTIPSSKAAMAKHQLLETLGKILEEVLEKYINRRSNIYLSIDRKHEMLLDTLLSEGGEYTTK
jgi:hypothetical protein